MAISIIPRTLAVLTLITLTGCAETGADRVPDLTQNKP